MISFRAACLFSLAALAGAAPARSEDRSALARELAAAHGLDAAVVAPLLAQAEYQQSIIDAITRPAEAKPWKVYRPIFLTAQRIADGRAFLAEHRAELAHLFALAQEEQLDIPALKGSYAGAMGWGQFMPSSYRSYAKDGDGNGRRDLFGSLPDVFASVANYFVAHGWQKGEPIAVPALRDAAAADFVPPALTPDYSLLDLAERGYRPTLAVGHPIKGTLVRLEGVAGAEYWIGFQNFYAITRYNRSPLYAMAVFQLAGEIAAGDPGAAPAP